jgi:hypothetical protein
VKNLPRRPRLLIFQRRATGKSAFHFTGILRSSDGTAALAPCGAAYSLSNQTRFREK